MIEARNLTVRRGNRAVLQGLDFSVQAGEVTAIVGPNGSGKSTLLKALTGELGYEGEVTMHGTPLSSYSPRQAAQWRAVLPQSVEMAFPFTVREVIRLGLEGGVSGLRGEALKQLPDQALHAVDLDGFSGRFYHELSGGEQQRVQLARVLCQVWEPVWQGRSRLLFLDEPVSSLDIRHQLLVMDVARDFARRGGTVICVLHDLNLASMGADRIVIIGQGKVAASGAPEEVLKDDLLSDVFCCGLRVGCVPRGIKTFVLPQTARFEA
ncbi:heme ABC transporter ATP-binding protein [Limoniibacter endophyticus]|uniref:Hemin import ATP-binding protein HmuV n=1 Tax=Limoniibacter endophyticus TaxID=1565040 RepID=A0A8J3DKA3_9HYPH|nr:heme ABC transporter ATP-binding protein [Limoniibacter endophyticus]GHC75750.1 hemin import ATP-binding protein HmuV [Limoniibacter endophyticus]